MSVCQTIIRTSLSCLQFGARTRDSAARHSVPFPLRIPGPRIKFHKPIYISRSFSYANGASPFEISAITEETAPPQESKEVTVQELLSKDRVEVSRLMKMDRRSSQSSEWKKGKLWFPYLDNYKAAYTDLSSSEVLEAVGPYLMDARKERFRQVVNNRSYSTCLVIEGLSDFGNVSAAFRSADALGIQSVHVVPCDSSRRYRDNRHVSMGAEKWLDIEIWSSVRECFENLKARGYRIATARLGMDTVSVYEIDWACPTAIVVGNEFRGISKEALELSDIHCSVTMRGMVDSFNVSVAAGIVMHQAVRDRAIRMGSHGDLGEAERRILLAEYYLRHNENVIRIVDGFSKTKSTTTTSHL